jgi:uncharacterized protein
MTRNDFIKMTALGVTSSSLFVTSFGTNPFHRQLCNRFYKVQASKELEGKRLLVLADIHYGSFFGELETKMLNDRVVSLNPDLVFFAGDLAHRPTTDLSGFLANWNSPGTHFFAPGNHDLPHRLKDSQSVLTQLKKSNIHVLNNDKMSFGDYSIIGMTSGLCGAPDLSLLDTKYNLVISHEPDLWDGYHGSLLHLAGHTHGGQIQILGHPVYLPALGLKYPEGLFSKGTANKLIVSRGIGATDINIRIGCPPEIVVVDFIKPLVAA